METESYLSGGCHCGRNRYVVKVPQTPSDLLVFLDNSRASRRTHAAPLAAFLRVPIALYHSATFAYYDDETHAGIRKTYQLRDDASHPVQTSRRQFCGFCGTQLTAWTEEQPGDGDYIAVTLGSMRDSDVEKLQTMGVLPSGDDTEEGEDEQEQEPEPEPASITIPSFRNDVNLERFGGPVASAVMLEGSPWFESMIQDTPLGRMRKQKGGHISRDGKTRIDWEVVEIDGGSTITRSTTTTDSLPNPGKRKLEE